MPLPRALVRAGAAGLLLLTLVYQSKGNHDLVWGTDPGSAVDLFNRDHEQALFTGGQNPFDVSTGSQPPWGYPTGVLLTWPPWPAVRAYFALLNLGALLFLMWWAYREARGLPPDARWLVAGAVAAFGGSVTATEVGQVGIVVTALLAGALWCDERTHPLWTGALVAFALIKPTVSAPFAIALLVSGRYRASAVAAGYGVAASAATWAITGATPWRMLGQLARAAGGYASEGTFGLVEILGPLGVPDALLNPAAAVVVTVPGLILMWTVRPSLPATFAVAAVWGRLWTYHKSYDDVMLAFVLVPLAIAALRARAVGPALAAFAAMGLLAWVPGRVLAFEPVQIAQLVVWPCALAVVLVDASRRPAPAAVALH
ncbi:MAG: glycosyltransferase family 87 protein [Vicinamibacterales bacterium]